MSQLVSEVGLLFLAHSVVFDIKASLVTGNHLFRKYLKYSKTEASISGYLPFQGTNKDFLFVRHENSFVCQ
jgi:hypothetical protein